MGNSEINLSLVVNTSLEMQKRFSLALQCAIGRIFELFSHNSQRTLSLMLINPADFHLNLLIAFCSTFKSSYMGLMETFTTDFSSYALLSWFRECLVERRLTLTNFQVLYLYKQYNMHLGGTNAFGSDRLKEGTCSICLDKYTDIAKPFRHLFHHDYLRHWNAAIPNCPICVYPGTW